ncbi:unnamed protein product [Plutella xylostella]|uniref:(diamondback moth) hypothetical protein n=1 Tax=Plutella xylostella TaxID=51655 RepID=A0A8S4G0I1_PLUXY|nr:unnamed protein product [Plutella xylostella]
MPAATTTAGEEQNDADQKMWNALKRYIIRERQRKKEEYEAEVEEERLRKEREARERQDVMTLEETKEQIEQLEQKLKQLEKEKQKLFMQLKKLLNEDEVRKRQQQKESNEMQPMKMGGMGGNMQMPMFSSMPSSGQGEPPPQGRGQPNDNHMMNKQPMGVQGVKRQRSPSPTYPHNMYPHRHQPPVKHQTMYTDHSECWRHQFTAIRLRLILDCSDYSHHNMYRHRHQPPVKHQTMYTDHKLEDGRRQLTARVLWNKPHSQYSNVGGTASSPYYCMSRPAAPRPPPLLYAPHPAHPLLYAPPQQPLYMDVNNKHDPNKDKDKVLNNKHDPNKDKVLNNKHDPNKDKVLNNKHDPNKDKVLNNKHDPNKDKVLNNKHDPNKDKVLNNKHDPNKDKVLNNKHDPNKDKVLNNKHDPNKDKVLNNKHDPNKDKVLNNKHDPNKGKVLNNKHDPNKDKVINNKHDPNKDKPQVLIGLSEAHHAAVSGGAVYAQPPASRHAPTHSHHAPMQTSKPGSITQGYPVQSNPNVQNPYPNRHRY